MTRPGQSRLLIGITLAAVLLAGSGVSLTSTDSDLIFSHALHVVENEIECASCHESIESSVSAADRNLPSMEACGDCHAIEGDGNCGQCHRDPDEPSGSPETDPTTSFNHKLHLGNSLVCADCHGNLADLNDETATDVLMPGMPTCMACHNGERADNDCRICHGPGVTLADIHPIDWRHQHGGRANLEGSFCAGCHQSESFCIDCHRSDNLTGNIHDLNYRFTHGLDARGKQADCAACHEQSTFCADCHASENRMPLAHSTLAWRTDHGRAARSDIENCASCHETDDHTCGRVGCHSDSDGLRGTDPRYHPPSVSRFDHEGAWHNDDGYFCYSCHTNTRRAGVGFCGYCHGGGE